MYWSHAYMLALDSTPKNDFCYPDFAKRNMDIKKDGSLDSQGAKLFAAFIKKYWDVIQDYVNGKRYFC